jgi:hypothetical protein
VAPASSSRQRPSLNHRRIVRTDGGLAGPARFPSRERSSAITAEGASPAANRRSASSLSVGQVYDPGRVGGRGAIRIWSRSAWSARERRDVKQPADSQTCMSDTTMSLPARLRRNWGSRCASQSQTDTPPGRCSCARLPRPLPTQIAHAGVFPSRSPL